MNTQCADCPLIRCHRYKWPGACESYLAARNPQPDPEPRWRPQPGLPVAFLGPICAELGGTERWHEMLFRHLDSKRIHVLGYGVTQCLDPDASKRFGVPVVEGLEQMKNLASRARVIVAWGLDNPKLVLPNQWGGIWISVAHGDEQSGWTRSWLERTDSVATQFVGVSEPACSASPRHRQCVVIEPGVPIPERVAQWRTNHLIYAGRYATDKQIPRIFEALRELPGWTLAMIGDGPNEAELRRLSEDLRSRIAWYRPDRSWWQHHAGICVLPSDSEGFGLAIAEGLAAGYPVVMRRVGMGAIPSFPGTLWESTETLAQAILRTTRKPQTHYQEWIRRNFDPQQKANQWCQLIESLVRAREPNKSSSVSAETTPLPIVLDRIRRVKSCPHRIDVQECGCSKIATCLENRGDLEEGRRTSYANCLKCQEMQERRRHDEPSELIAPTA